MDIGKVLKLARKKQGKTQTEIAQSCYVVDAVISNYENGKSMPDLSMILKLCNVLNISLDELKTGTLSDETDKNLPPEVLDKHTLSATLKEFRICAGLSQTDEAAQVFVTSQTVCKWESGATLPSFENLCRLSELYAADVTVFFTGEKRKTKVVGEGSDKTAYKGRAKITKVMSLIFAALFLICFTSTAIMSVKYINARNEGTAVSAEITRKDGKIDELEKNLSEKDRLLEDKNNALNEKDRLIEDKSNALDEKDSRINDLESSVGELSERIEDLKNLSGKEVVTLTLKNPDGNSKIFYLLSGVTTTVTTGQGVDVYCRYYENEDGTGESYGIDEFTITLTKNLTLYAVYKAKWVDFSLAKTDEEREILTSVENELCSLELAFKTLSSVAVESCLSSSYIDEEYLVYRNIIIKKTNGTYFCVFAEELRRIEKMFSDFSAFSELSSRLLKAADYCEEFIKTCIENPNTIPSFPDGIYGEEKRVYFISNYLVPQTECIIPVFRELCKSFYGLTNLKDFRVDEFNRLEQSYGFYECYSDWLVENGYWY